MEMDSIVRRPLVERVKTSAADACVIGVKWSIVLAMLIFVGKSMLQFERGVVEGANNGKAATTYLDALTAKGWLPAPLKRGDGRFEIPDKDSPAATTITGASAAPSPSPSPSPSK